MIKKNHLIYSVCKKNKFGLLDIANSLVMYGTRIDPERKYKIIVTFASAFIVFYQQFLSLINLRATEKVTFIIWDNSLFTLCIAFIARFSSINIIYYYHEPGGIKHKLSLNASLSYSILASLIENIFISLSSRVAVSQKDKLLYADFYLPLLYSDIRPNHLHGNNIIGYIGKLKGERMPDLLLQLESELKKQGYTIEYFPSKSNGTSQTDKFDFLSKCDAIWNVFRYPYILSGVTGDAFMSSTPLIVSSYEPFKNMLKKNNLLIEIDYSEPPTIILQKIVQGINKCNIKPCDGNERNRAQSMFAGEKAFREFWLKAFETLEAEK